MISHLFYQGDSLEVLRKLPAESVHCCVTSPPYWGLRDYGAEGQIGLEETPEQFLNRLVNVFTEVKRVLKPDGTLWLNIGDGYTSGNRGYRAPDKKNPARAMSIRPDTPDGLKPKDLIGIPWMVAFALRADGWYLRSDIIWAKPNPMPESVTDRPTKAHEYIFLLSKSERYFYDAEAVKEQSVSDHPSGNGFKRDVRLSYRDKNGARGNENQWQVAPSRNRRTVWTIATQPYPGAHFATFPQALVEPCILAGCPEGGTVIDPFGGSGTVSLVAKRLGRGSIYIDLNPEYLQMALKRMGNQENLFEQHSIEVIQ